VDIRPRVTGYLVKMPFREGADVKEGDVLFEIDERPYKATLDQARGEVERQKASLVKAQADYDIALAIQKENPKAISQQELAKRLGARDEAAGQLKANVAAEERAKLNYDWCKVTSPISGQVSKYYLTLGNLATQDATVLTTVVSHDPMYAYFDMDERTMLYILRKIIGQAKEDALATKQVPVLMGLADEEGFPHKGYVDFANNKVDPSTGTITVRGVFANPVLENSHRRLLRPGMFVRIRLPLGQPHPALLVAERALQSDQGQKYLLVIEQLSADGKGVVRYRRVKTGPLQDDGLRVIESGELKESDWVITRGLQMVRPKMEVMTEKAPMPVLNQADEKPAEVEK
jgi:multidrug efflux system membrane fusion protein